MAARFELTAAAAEDPRLAERLRSEPPDARRALLAEADSLARGSEAQRCLAATVYTALQDDVDPATADGVRRVAWLVASPDAVDRACAPLLERTARACPDPATRLRAAALAARFAEDAGDGAASATALRVVEESAGGRGGPAARGLAGEAHLDLAAVAIRREDAAAALAAAAHAASAGLRGRHGVLVRILRAETFALMGDPPRCERELAAAEPEIVKLSLPERRSARADVAAVRVREHVAAGDFRRALDFLVPAADAGAGTSPARVCALHVAGARAHLALGRTGEGAAHLARALRTNAGDGALAVEMEMLQIRLQHAAGGVASSRPRALALVAGLAGPDRHRVGPLRRAAMASRLAGMLAESAADAPAVLRARDLAATSVTEALGRLARPHGCAGDDAAALRAHRDRVAAERTAVARAAAAFLESQGRGAGSGALAGRSALAGVVACCPWCDRVRLSAGAWRPFEDVLGSEDVADLALGACDDCGVQLVRRAAAAAAR